MKHLTLFLALALALGACGEAPALSEPESALGPTAPQFGVHVNTPIPPDANAVIETLILCKEWRNAANISVDFDVTVDDLRAGGASTTLTRTLTDTGSRECRAVACFDGTTNFCGRANLQIVETVPGGSALLDIVVTAVDPAGDVIDATGAPWFSTIDVATGTWSAQNADNTIGFKVEYFNELTQNQPPAADANGPYTGTEGSPVTLDGSGSSDPDVDPLTYSWTVGGSPVGTAQSTSPTLEYTFADGPLEYEVCVTVDDGNGASDRDCTTATISNAAPTCGPISTSVDLVQVNGAITATASFTDAGVNDVHTALWDWDFDNGDTSAGTVSETNGSGTVGPDTHMYTDAGIYKVGLTVTDSDGGTCGVTYEFVVVYDPSGGFVTGGGWIYSEAGAYRLNTELEGKATFGFVSKYKKGASTPTGNTEFQFHAEDMNFKSDVYDWLVVNQGGRNAQFKGDGTINGAIAPNGENYRFMLWAGDDDRDTFRIRIWYEGGIEVVVYDNGVQAIDGGSIVIHKK